ncbi:MAG: hypothetical protein ABSE82_11020 [Nitrososphaerales archaeon]|jgi:hypothetical protein
MNPRINPNPGATSSFRYPLSDWQLGYQDKDSYDQSIAEAAYFQNGGDSVPCTYLICYNELSLWIGLTTNTGSFIQLSVAWGDNGCSHWDDNAPSISYGYTGPNGGNQHLNNCPYGYTTNYHSYLLEIWLDAYVTGDWYVYVFDATAYSTLFDTQLTVPTGTYAVNQNNIGVILEGSASSVDGNWLSPNSQGMSQLSYCDTSGCYNFGTINDYGSPGSGGVPSNIGESFSSSTSTFYKS